MQEEKSVTITVSDPEVRKEYGGARQYYLYTLKGHDSKGLISIHRRYSDFDLIRGLLVKRWPGCYIPSLPSKVKLTHSDEEFLETRSKYLQKFLLEVSRKPFLWNSDEMQIFLRNEMMEFDKLLAPLWKVEPAELLYRYGQCFSGVAAQGAMEVRIANFGQYLGTLFVKVQELRNRSEEINSAQSKYQKKYSKFLLNVLASYEEKFLQYYNKDNPAFSPIFSAPQNEQKKNELEQSLKQAPLRVLFEQLKREKREIFAMQQALKQYDDYLKQKVKLQAKIKDHQTKITQLKAGHKSFFSKIRSLSSDDQVRTHEKAIEKYKQELSTLIELCEIMTRVLLVSEIQSFKQQRTTSYYRMVHQIAQQELKIIEKERDFWLSVASNNCLNFEIEENLPSCRNYNQIKKQLSLQQTENKIQKCQQHKQKQPLGNEIEKDSEKVEEKKEGGQKNCGQSQENQNQDVEKKETIKIKPKEIQDKEADITEKTKSVSDSPNQHQSSTDSPHEPILEEDFKSLGEEEEIKNSSIQIDLDNEPEQDDAPPRQQQQPGYPLSANQSIKKEKREKDRPKQIDG